MTTFKLRGGAVSSRATTRRSDAGDVLDGGTWWWNCGDVLDVVVVVAAAPRARGGLCLGSLSESGVEFPRVGLELYWGFEAFVSERLFDLTLQSTARTKHKIVSLQLLLASLQGLVFFLSLTGQIRESHLLQALKL